MSVRRTVAATLGVLAFLLAVAVVVAPDAVGASGVETAVTAFDVDRPVLLVVASLAGVSAAWTTITNRRDPNAALPSPESVTDEPAHVAGEVIDEGLAAIAEGEAEDGVRERVRGVVFDAAVTTLTRTERWSEDECLRRLEEGSWTDDPRAAAFLGGPEADRPPLRVRLRDLLSADPTFARRARAAVRELSERSDRLDRGESA